MIGMSDDKKVPQSKEVDIYRDTPVRLLGYANEVGEAFRAQLHVNWVRLSYGVAMAYVTADTYDKGIKTSKMPFPNETARKHKVMNAVIDTLIWQTLASVVIPGFTINRVCAASLHILKKSTKLPSTTRKWVTTAIGLSCIPFIVHPIDTLVHYGMDHTVRKMLGTGPT